MKIEVPTTLTIDEKNYQVADFSDVVKRLLIIHTTWRNQLQDEKMAVMKTELSLQALDIELTQTVRKELGEKANTPPAPSAPDVKPKRPGRKKKA